MEDLFFDESNQSLNIDIAGFLKKMLAHWKLIFLISFSSAVIGAALTFGEPKEFTVVSKVAPELSLRANSLTSLASMAGLSMNMLSNNNDALLPTVYPEIIASVPFVTDLFDMPVNDSTLFNYMLNDCKGSFVGTVVNLPGTVIGKVVDLFKKDDSFESDENIVDTWHLTKDQYRIYKALRKSIKVEVDKKTFLVTLIVKAQDPEVAANLSKSVIENLKSYVTDYRTGKAKQNADFLAKAYESARNDYYVAQRHYAAYCDAHQNILSQKAQVEKQRLSNETNLKYQLYSSIAQQLQQAEVTVQQESPVFAEVVPPTVPLRKTKPQRTKTAVAFFIIGALLSCAYVHRKYND